MYICWRSAMAVHICAMKWLIFSNGRVYLCDGIGLYLAMAVYICVMELAYVLQWPCIFV